MPVRKTATALVSAAMLAYCAPSSPPRVATQPKPPIVEAPPPRTVDASSPNVADASVAIVDAAPPDASPVVATTPDPPKCQTRVLGQHEGVSHCKADDDCKLHVGGCCPPCGTASRSFVRVSRVDGEPGCRMGCPACASMIAPGFSAACRAGRCAVVETICGSKSTPCPPVRKPRLLPRVMPANVASCQPGDVCKLMAENCCSCSVISGDQVIAVRADAGVACKKTNLCTSDCLAGALDPTLVAVCDAGLCRVKDTGVDPICMELSR